MLCLSQTTGYAIEALAHLEPPGGRPSRLRDIALQARVPRPYLAKRMPELVAAGLVTSIRGRQGGVKLARPPSEITLLQISEAVEARQWLGRCLLGLTTCSDERACPAHTFWKDSRQQIESLLRHTTLADVMAHELRVASSGPAVPPGSSAQAHPPAP
jgi:Rrf2 family transcriptional regulator, iron-sulfur cluster assembly transcription factor